MVGRENVGRMGGRRGLVGAVRKGVCRRGGKDKKTEKKTFHLFIELLPSLSKRREAVADARRTVVFIR